MEDFIDPFDPVKEAEQLEDWQPNEDDSDFSEAEDWVLKGDGYL